MGNHPPQPLTRWTRGAFRGTKCGRPRRGRGHERIGLAELPDRGLIAGWVADKVMQRGHGLVQNLVVGVVGAYLGALLFWIFGLAATGFIGALVIAIVGSVVLLAIVGAVQKR